jgi:hypothetical protein
MMNIRAGNPRLPAFLLTFTALQMAKADCALNKTNQILLGLCKDMTNLPQLASVKILTIVAGSKCSKVDSAKFIPNEST